MVSKKIFLKQHEAQPGEGLRTGDEGILIRAVILKPGGGQIKNIAITNTDFQLKEGRK